MRKYLKVLYMVFPFFAVQAQELLPISKEEVLSKVKERNVSLKIYQEDYNQARADFLQTNAVFLPNITASHTGISTTNPLMAFGSKLNQEILTQADFNPALLNDPSQTKNFATKLEIQQPLINVDGFYQRRAAKTKMEAVALQEQRASEYLDLEVEKAYMQLQLAYMGVAVLEKALEAANANRKLAENSYEQGYLQKTDVLSVQMRVIEVQNQLHTARSNVENSSNYMSFLMNDEGLVVYEPTDSLTLQSYHLSETTMISENRPDVKAMQLASDAYQTMHKANMMNFLPRLNAFGSYEMYDDQIFQGNATGYTFGAQLSWDLFQGSKRFGKIQKSKSEFEKSKLELEEYVSQGNLELNKVRRMLKDAENKVALSQLALEQSEEALRIRTNRYKVGLERTTDLLMAETQYVQKQLEYYQTVFEYNYALAYLQFLTKE